MICKKIRSVWNETYARTTRKIYISYNTSVCLRFSEIAYIFNVGPNTVFPEETVEELNHG